MLMLTTPKALLKRLRLRTSSSISTSSRSRSRSLSDIQSHTPSRASDGGTRVRRTRSFSAGETSINVRVSHAPIRRRDETRARNVTVHKACDRALAFAVRRASSPKPAPEQPKSNLRPRPRSRPQNQSQEPTPPKPKNRPQIDLTHYRRNHFDHYDCPVVSCLARFLHRDKLIHHVQHEHHRHHIIPLYCAENRTLLLGAAAFNAHMYAHRNVDNASDR